MQRWLGLFLLKHSKDSRCVLWAVSCQMAFPCWRVPTELQKHVQELPCPSWALARVVVLSCLNLCSPGVQAVF